MSKPSVGVEIDFAKLRKEDWCHTCFHAGIHCERSKGYHKLTGRIFKKCFTMKGIGRKRHGAASFMEKITHCEAYFKSPQWNNDDIPEGARGR